MNAPLPPDAVAVCSLRVADILPSPSNPRKRFDTAYISDLAQSIKNHGLIQPITVRPLPIDSLFAYNKANPNRPDGADVPSYEIVVGECRWRAAREAGLTEIPAFWRELDDLQALEIQVVENLQRRDVHPIEEAEGYQALIKRHGYKADDIAAKIGKSRSYVYGRLKFADLCRDARDAFYEGRLDASSALLVARIPGETLQKKATKEITCGYDNQPLSFRNAKSHILARYTLRLDLATFKADDATLLPTAGSCTDCPKRSGNCRDLFNDIDDPDVCTDPDCFEEKRLARRAALIANAEKRKIPVLLGDKGREALNGDIDYVSLDAEIDDDAEGRTYRQVLGDKIKPAALIEFPYGKREPTECAELSVLEAALRKAGWKPEEAPPPATDGMTPEEKAKVEADHARRQAEAKEHEEQRQLAEDETAARKAAQAAIWPALHAIDIDTDKRTQDLLYLLAEAWLRHQCDCNEMADLEDDIRTHIDADYALPDEFDEEPEIKRAIALVRAAPVSRALSLVFSSMVTPDAHVNPWNLRDTADREAATPFITQSLAQLLEVPFASLSHPAPTPSKAAHAAAKSAKPAAAAKAQSDAKKPAAKKAKAKADPAPTTSANEPPAAVKSVNPVPAWPFPTGARP